MVDIPPLAQQGDELKRQAMPTIEGEIANQKSFTDYLSERRSRLQTRLAPTGDLGQARESLASFEGAPANVNPFDQFGLYKGVQQADMDLASGAINQEQTARNSLLDALMGLEQMKAKKAQDQMGVLEQLKIIKEYKDLGFDYNPETGIPVPIETSVRAQSKIEGLTKGERGDITGAATALSEMKRLREKIAALSGGDKTQIESILTGVTGPLSKMNIVDSVEKQQLRTDLDTLAQNIRKEFYGTVVSKQEAKVAQLPGSGRQEATNLQILDSFMKKTTEELDITLKSAGLNNEEIEAYKASIGLTNKAPNNKDDAAAKLRAKGFSEEKIQEYLKTKGL
jgi:hypothetical protein